LLSRLRKQLRRPQQGSNMLRLYRAALLHAPRILAVMIRLLIRKLSFALEVCGSLSYGVDG